MASISLGTPGTDAVDGVVRALGQWQNDEASVQLHPGDVGWNWRFGAQATAAALRTWSREEEILAVGFLDSATLVRLAVAPERRRDQELVDQMLRDVSEPERGILPPGPVSIEARFDGPFREGLRSAGWEDGELWTPLRRDLAEPVEACGVRIEVVGPQSASVRTDVHRASFEESTFDDACWRAMAGGALYAEATCLVAFDDQDAAVAAVTVWSAGAGKPGLLEPMGVHRDHRGRGYGRAITLAAAGALRQRGSSSATVCTRSSNVGAVATYRSAGFQQLPDVPDLERGDVRRVNATVDEEGGGVHEG